MLQGGAPRWRPLAEPSVRSRTATSSRGDRSFVASREWRSDDGFFDIGEIVAWILIYEEDGQRGKD